MNSKKLGEWLGITANLGVILGIAILAFEINQSTKATAAAVSDSVMNTLGSLCHRHKWPILK